MQSSENRLDGFSRGDAGDAELEFLTPLSDRGQECAGCHAENAEAGAAQQFGLLSIRQESSIVAL